MALRRLHCDKLNLNEIGYLGKTLVDIPMTMLELSQIQYDQKLSGLDNSCSLDAFCWKLYRII